MSPAPDSDWQARIDALWAQLDAMPPEAFVSAVDALAAERPADDAAALFERACARDSTGVEDEAELLYRQALASGRLDAYRTARASMQLASTLRHLGRLDESEALLLAELDRHMQPGHDRALHDEARALLAFTYVAQGRATEAAGLALCTLAPHLTRYNRSTFANAAELVDRHWG